MLNYDETYISVEDAEAYANLMGLTLPADLENGLRRAAIYLDRLYGARYISSKYDETQFLAWPRYDYPVTPKQLGFAQVELAAAIEENGGTLPSVEPRVKKTVTKLDELETSIEYAGDEGYGVNPYASIDSILFPYVDIVTNGIVATPRIYMTRGA